MTGKGADNSLAFTSGFAIDTRKDTIDSVLDADSLKVADKVLITQ